MRALKTSLMVFLLVAVIVSLPKLALAGPIVQVDVTVTGVAPYTYSYTVYNLSDSTENVWTFSVYFTVPIFEIVAPTGWDFLSGPDFVTWYSMGYTYDIPIGGNLSGFAFKSFGPPGTGTFDVEGSDPFTGNPTGNTFCGTTLVPTPEPIGAMLFSIGLAGFWGFIRRKRQ